MYTFDDYKLILQDTGRRDKTYNKAIVKYTFISPDNRVIFDGEDFNASPMHDSESLESAKTLLAFLTLQEGDVEDEYFDDYTDEQKAFRDSLDCESLKLYTFDE
jgi:hypothetical protein